MIRVAAVVVAGVLALAGAVRAAGEPSPHVALQSDGELNMETCGACHTDDLSLERSKLETCTLCHSDTPHAGAHEHVTANAAAVEAALKTQPKEGPTLPLGDDGRMYCGTCHLFHDPKVDELEALPPLWVPPDHGLSGTVRQAVIDRWATLGAKAGEKEPLGKLDKGTRYLRLPVNQGQLCRQCHGAPR